MNFEKVIGQEKVKEGLLEMAQSKHIPHAMLFHGPEGCGGLALALAWAAYLQCENPSETDRCGVCNACVKCSSYTHPDIHFTYPVYGSKNDSTTFITQWRNTLRDHLYFNLGDWLAVLEKPNSAGNINARECERIIRNVNLKRGEGNYKIWIIWQAEFLWKEGNKLLKTLEEPPEGTLFILVANKPNKILPTILSRTQQLRIPPVSDQAIMEYLTTHASMGEEEAKRSAFIAMGNATKALHFAQEGPAFQEDWVKAFWPLLFQLSRSWQGDTLVEFVDWVNEAAGRGRTAVKAMIIYQLYFLRETLQVLHNCPHRLNEQEYVLAQSLLDRVSPAQISVISQELNTLHYGVERNGNPKVLLLHAGLSLAKAIQTPVII